MIRAPQTPVDARRRDLQRIRSGHGIMHVQHVSKLATDARKIVEGHAPLAVEVEAQHHPSAFPAEFYVYHFKAFVRHQRLGNLPDPLSYRLIHVSSNKKVGTVAHPFAQRPKL
jgi:hypothetical protein